MTHFTEKVNEFEDKTEDKMQNCIEKYTILRYVIIWKQTRSKMKVDFSLQKYTLSMLWFVSLCRPLGNHTARRVTYLLTHSM
jgi:hypothetical protein